MQVPLGTGQVVVRPGCATKCKAKGSLVFASMGDKGEDVSLILLSQLTALDAELNELKLCTLIVSENILSFMFNFASSSHALSSASRFRLLLMHGEEFVDVGGDPPLDGHS